jgi:hypothetical protein
MFCENNSEIVIKLQSTKVDMQIPETRQKASTGMYTKRHLSWFVC